MKNKNGYTLVEALIAVLMGSLVLMAIYSAINTVQTSSSKIESKVAAQQDSRGAMELMAMEIQMASYNPTSQSGIWVVGQNDCVRCGQQSDMERDSRSRGELDNRGNGYKW